MATTYIKAPAGFPRRYIIISADEQGITELGFDDTAPAQTDSDNPHIRQCIHELDEYFARKRQDFSVKLNPHGTEFQTRCGRSYQLFRLRSPGLIKIWR